MDSPYDLKEFVFKSWFSGCLYTIHARRRHTFCRRLSMIAATTLHKNW